MDFRSVVLLLVFGYFLASYIVVPVVRAIVNFVKLAKLKREVLSFGEEIIKLPQKQIVSKKVIWVCCICIVGFILLGVFIETYLMFIGAVCLLPIILDLILIRKYAKYTGIYENGIVIGNFIEYKNLVSWKKKDNTKISILKQDGLRFDLETHDKQTQVTNYLTSKGVLEET